MGDRVSQDARTGTAATDGSRILLSDLFENQFRIDRPRYANGRAGERVKMAVRYLTELLGRPPAAKDLTRAVAAELRQLIELKIESRARQTKIYTGLCAIWSYAAWLGINPAFDPPDRDGGRARAIVGKSRRRSSGVRPIDDSGRGKENKSEVFFAAMRFVRSPATGAGSDQSRPTGSPIPLTEYFERDFRSQVRERGSSCYATQFRRAIRLFSDALARDATVADLERHSVEQFREYLAGSGLQRATQQYLYVRLIRIWRWARRSGLVESFDPPHRKSFNGAPPLPTAAAGTLRAFFEQVYIPERLIGRTAEHLTDMRGALKSLRRRIGRDANLQEIDAAMLADYFGWLLERGLSRPTINNHRVRLLAILRFAHEKGAIERVPNIRKVKEFSAEVDSWSLEELSAIVAAARNFSPGRMVGHVAASDFWLALILTGYWTGQRRKALFSIRTVDVDFASGTISFRPEFVKAGRFLKRRIGADAIDAIKRIWNPEHTLLFPWPHYHGVQFAQFREIVAAAGVRASRRPTLNLFHLLRRTAATWAAVRGGSEAAAKLLDHEKTEVTKRYIDDSRGHGAMLPLPEISPSSGDPLDKAAILLARGDCVEAAMMARVAIEKLLRQRCGTRRTVPKRTASIGQLADWLVRKRVVSRTFQKEVSRLLKIANPACHLGEVTPEAAEQLVEGVKILYSSQNGRFEQ